ncbi:MAG: hypothetical protein HIU91_00365 [Acidobacteria bacterium]|nr:hypothetical protein [Acidobacteriota bacterium]
MRQLLAIGIVFAGVAAPMSAQHGSGVAGGVGFGGRGGGAVRAGGVARSGAKRGMRPRYGSSARVMGYGVAGRTYGGPGDSLGRVGAVRGGSMLPDHDRDGDADGDGRRRGYGRGGRFGEGRGGRFGEGWGGRGIPYANPYGYGDGYPLMYSGLTYAGDLGFGDDNGYGQGANGDDGNDGSGDDSTQGYNDQAPVPYAQGDPQDEGPAGYAGPNGYSGGGGDGYGYGSMPPAGAGYGYGPGKGSPSSYGYAVPPVNRALSTASSRSLASAGTGDGSADASNAVTLVFKDGRPPETIHNYALTRTTLYVTDSKPREIAVDDLNLPATEKVNREAGVKFQLPD